MTKHAEELSQRERRDNGKVEIIRSTSKVQKKRNVWKFFRKKITVPVLIIPPVGVLVWLASLPLLAAVVDPSASKFYR